MGKGSAVVRIAAAIAVLALFAFAPPASAADEPKPDAMVNNPPFENWSSFPVGTAVTQRETVQLNDGTKVAVDIISKLVKKSKESVVVETTMAEVGGNTSSGVAGATSTTATYPAQVKMSQVDTPAAASNTVTEGTDAVAFQGKTATAEWTNVVTRVGDEVTEEKIWTLKDIPDGIFRRTIVKKKDGEVTSSSTLELVDVKPGA